jgi:hypothetical protein
MRGACYYEPNGAPLGPQLPVSKQLFLYPSLIETILLTLLEDSIALQPTRHLDRRTKAISSTCRTTSKAGMSSLQAGLRKPRPDDQRVNAKPSQISRLPSILRETCEF